MMLARLLRAAQDDKISVVSLMGISQRNRDLANNPHVIYAPLGVSSSLGMLGSAIRLARLIRAERPKAILCWMYHAMVVGLIAQRLACVNVPVVWNVRQSLDDPGSFSQSTRLALNFGRTLSGIPSGIIYNSARALELHGKYGYKNRNAVVIPNGFDLPENVVFAAKAPRIFGIAGRFHPQKDHETFFRAAALVAQTNPNARFRAVGLGLTPNNPAVAEMLTATGLPPSSIELCGEFTDMSSFYRNIDVLVLSSRTEGFPNVVAEAMSYGKPVVTTDVGDAAAIVGDTGWVVPPRNPESLAAAIRSVINLPPDIYAETSRRARAKIANEYELHAIERTYQNFLEAQTV